MSDIQSPEASSPPQPPMVYVLQFFAVLVAAATVIGSLVAIARISSSPGESTVLQVVSVAGLVAGGLAAAAGLAALAAVIRSLATGIRSVGAETAPAAGAGATPAPAGMTAAQGEAIQRLLEEIRDNVLMTDDERREKRERMIALERRQRFTLVQQAIEAGLYHRARLIMQEAEQRLGSDDETRQLAEQIEIAARQAESKDVEAATRQCEDLMSVNAWERASRIAQDLAERHPNSQTAAQLLSRVQRERQAYETEHRARLYADVQRWSAERQWRRALITARELVQAYPESGEAQALRAQRETLEMNAQIEHRKELESRYKEFVDTKQFAEALALARQVINEYPESPQAQVMRKQLPQLERQVQTQVQTS